MSSGSFEHYLSHYESLLKTCIEETPIPCAKIKEATLYSLFPGGKRFRPLLVYLSGQLLHVDQHSLDTIALSVELMHCYSLIHDDLPAMDNDDYRRGKPSCHRAFDEATAILVGDGLQALAIELLLTRLPQSLSMHQVNAITRELVHAIGPGGMVSGQGMDLSELNGCTIDESRLKEIHQLKTGKLISACINMVLNAGNPTEKESRALQAFTHHLGLLFQMQDDYLDHYSSAQLGKHRASDKANKKITYARLYEQKELLLRITQHYEHALQTLSLFKPLANELQNLLQSLQQRLEA